MTAHRADLEEMRSVVAGLAARSGDVEVLADRLTRQHTLLDPWAGRSADAHDDARARWDDGFAAMRAALVSMRAVVAHAESVYAAAADRNVAAWAELS